MGRLLERVTRDMLRRGLRRGLLEGNDLWLAATVVALVVRLISRPDKVRIVREDLRVGDSILVSHVPPPPTRRAARRERRRGADGA